MKAKIRAHDYKMRKAAKRASSVATEGDTDTGTDAGKASLATECITTIDVLQDRITENGQTNQVS
jgi:hypothetical protein